jgi:hypothetical protein
MSSTAHHPCHSNDTRHDASLFLKIGIHIDSAPLVTRWAQLCLPNGQVTQSAWKENTMSRQPRMARNVKVMFFFLINHTNILISNSQLCIDGHMSIAEVYLYFNMLLHNQQKTFALVSEFSQPHMCLSC